jgi:hypothetical protein
MDELAHGLYFSIAVVPQTIRLVLEIFKDKMFPTNRMIYQAWEATMGFQMRQNSHLAMNWKTQYLGWFHGLLDSSMVAYHLLIVAPWVAHHWGWGMATGSVAAAYATGEVLRNFLAYFQSGAHSYSADVKMIHLLPAEAEAKRKLQAQGINPDSVLNEALVQNMTNQELAKIYSTVGLPGENEFIYDPLTMFDKIIAAQGYTLDGLSDEQKAEVAKRDFVLSRRRHGLTGTALIRALEMAEQIYRKSPSESGRKTVELLQWAMKERGVVRSMLRQVDHVASTGAGEDELKAAIDAEVASVNTAGLLSDKVQLAWAGIRGGIKYIAKTGTEKARDINKVMFRSTSTEAIPSLSRLLPESWLRQAGSPVVAEAGAELFRRAFFALYEGKLTKLQPNEAARGKHGDLVNRYLDQEIEQGNHEYLKDPFLRELKFEMLIDLMDERAKAREAVAKYKPHASSKLATIQWGIARWEADKIFEQISAGGLTSPIWMGMADNYNENVNKKFSPGGWEAAYHYRFIVAKEMAKQVGLTVDDPEESEFVRKVTVKAAVQAEVELNLPEQRSFLNKQNEVDRKFYEAQIYFHHFVATYVDMSVRSEDHLSAQSPEYPGRFQAIRRWSVTAKGGATISKVVRVVEALFRNEDSSFQPGEKSWLNRNVPIVPDLIHNFSRSLRTMPYMFTLSYLTSYYIWNIHIPYSMWVATGIFGFIHPALVEWNNRLMKNFGVKPMEDLPSKAKYSFNHSNLTNIEPMILQNNAAAIQGAFEAAIVGPVKHALSACAALLLGAGSNRRHDDP